MGKSGWSQHTWTPILSSEFLIWVLFVSSGITVSDCLLVFNVFIFRKLLIGRSRVLNPHFVDEEAEIKLCANS